MGENTLPRATHPEVIALLDELVASARPSSRTLPLPDGRRNFDELIAPLTDYPVQYVIDPEYMMTFTARPGYRVVQELPFFNPFRAGGHDKILLLKREASP